MSIAIVPRIDRNLRAIKIFAQTFGRLKLSAYFMLGVCARGRCGRESSLTVTRAGLYTKDMAQTFLVFDFGGNEESAQQARLTLERWKQGFRLDKKLLLKFDRQDVAEEATTRRRRARRRKRRSRPGAIL